MDATGEGLFLIVRQPVEDIERGMEQDFRHHAPVNPFPVLLVKQLHRRLENGGSAVLGAGWRTGRRARRGCAFGARGHPRILARIYFSFL
jgi:hypothetical protein